MSANVAYAGDPAPPMSRIVISYRRADSAAITGRIFDRLVQRYGPAGVFMDVDEIPFGIDFRDHIAQVLSTCDGLVAVIGPRWLGAEGERRRIDEESDPVRVEVRAALERGIPVIPVLVDGAAMPGAGELPEPIRPLAFRNACPVDSGRDFHAHVDRLIRSMDRVLGASLLPRGTEEGDRASGGGGGAPPTDVAGPLHRAAHGPPPPRAGEDRAAAPPLTARQTALLVGFIALPHLLQFSQRKEFFLVGLFVSTVGVVAVLDRPGESPPRRALAGLALMCAVVVGQSALGLLRASVLPW